MANEYRQYFLDKAAKGELGEVAFMNLCSQRNIRVIPVTDVLSEECDFILADGTRIEVKTQDYFFNEGAIFIEFFDSTNRRHNGLGWYYTSSADYYCFYEVKNDLFVVVPATTLKNAVKRAENTNRMHKRTFDTCDGNTTEVGFLTMDTLTAFCGEECKVIRPDRSLSFLYLKS